MKTHANSIIPPVADSDWAAFPGGELEGRRPKVLCRACRERLHRRFDSHRKTSAETGGPGAPLCFDCYRAELARERALKAAGELDTASEARFQSVLPLEPVNRSRLIRLQAERESARLTSRSGTGVYVDRRRQAQIAARHALQQIGAGLRRHAAMASAQPTATGPAATTSNGIWSAVHAAELQLPETWLPFVTAR